MARRKSQNEEALESPPMTATELQADEAGAAGLPTAEGVLPILEPPESGKLEVPVDPPIDVFVRDQHGGMRPREVFMMERTAEFLGTEGVPVHAVGSRVRSKSVAETVYVVREVDPHKPPGQLAIGSYVARELVLPDQIIASRVTAKQAKKAT